MRSWQWYRSYLLAAGGLVICVMACSAENSPAGPGVGQPPPSGQQGAAGNAETGTGAPTAGSGGQSGPQGGTGDGTQDGPGDGTQDGPGDGTQDGTQDGRRDGASQDGETPPQETPFGGDDACAAVAQEAENRYAPSDIIWAVDTSGSIADSMDAILASLNKFSQTIIDAGIDAHIVMLAAGVGMGFGGPGFCIPQPLGSGQCGGSGLRGSRVEDSREPEFLHLEVPIGATMPIPAILEFYPTYAQVLRPDSKKQFAIVEDAGPLFDTPQSFRDAVAAMNPPVLDGEFSFHGVYCDSGACSPSCDAAVAPPPTYQELVASTGGISGNLCNGEAAFTDLLDRLAEQVIVGAELACEWDIPEPPPGEVFDKNQVNVRYTSSSGAVTDFLKVPPSADCGPGGGWFYDDEANPGQVLACPVTCDQIRGDVQGRIDVFFGCETLYVIE